MAELTTEEEVKAESMSLDELRAAAAKEAEPVVEAPASNATPAEELDNSADTPEEAEQIFRKVIENEDGTVDVYEADSIEGLVDKIAAAKQAAVVQMKKVQAEKRELSAKTAQEQQDADYITGEKFKEDPVKATREIAAQVLIEREASAARSTEAQSRFVNTHTDYVADPKNGNGNRMVAEYTRLFPDAKEFTSEGLEKAYLNLKRDGLLVLRSEEADAATEVEVKVIARTEQPEAEATQQRSPKRSSTISTRTSTRVSAPVKQEPTEDELYSMPLEKLRALADKQLAEAQRDS